MKYLVIGGSGFVGSHLCKYLTLKGIEVIGTRNDSNNQDLVKFNLEKDNFFHFLKKTYNNHYKNLIIVICYKYGLMDKYVLEKNKSYKLEVIKIREIVDLAKSLDIKIVYLSTSYIFDGKTGNYSEDSIPNPLSEYGSQKLDVDNYISKNVNNSLILRLDKIVGDNPKENHLFTEWQNCLVEKKTIMCIKNQILSPTHVDDVVRGIFLACEKKLKGVYHHANPKKFKRYDLAKIFAKIMNVKANINQKHSYEFGMLEERPKDSSLDVRKFTNSISMTYTPITNVLNSFKNNLKLYN